MRVLVLTAPVGDGHLSAARTLADDIATLRPDASVSVVDALEELPRPLAWLVRDAYRWQLGAAPWLFATLFGALRRSRALRAVARWTLSLVGSRSILRIARHSGADVVVSTWPVTTTILGCLRLRGKLRSPVCATITDFAGLELWSDRGVDLHVVMHPALVDRVERLAGTGSAEAVAPLIGAEFRAPRGRRPARRALDLPADGRIVVVSGGGWGVGALEDAARGALALSGVTVVCLAGRDERTRARLARVFASDPRVSVLGFTDRMSDLLAAADVLVHSTGGVTCLEAMARGCPIVAYRPPPGHSPLLAREMSRLGLLVHARTAAELRVAIVRAVRAPLAGPAATAAMRVLELQPRVARRLRTQLVRPFALAASTALALAAFSTSALAYRPVAEVLRLPDETTVTTDRHAVGLVIEGRRADLLAFTRAARAAHVHASVATEEPLSAADARSLRAAGLDPIAEIAARGLGSWLQTRRELAREQRALGFERPFVYLAPSRGLTVSEYLIARHLGGRPVRSAATLAGNLVVPKPGAIATAQLAPGVSGQKALLRSIGRVERRGEAVEPVPALLQRGRATR